MPVRFPATHTMTQSSSTETAHTPSAAAAVAAVRTGVPSAARVPALTRRGREVLRVLNEIFDGLARTGSGETTDEPSFAGSGITE